MFLMDLECVNVDSFMKNNHELSVKLNKLQLKDSVLNYYYISFDSLKCHSVSLWRCFNLKMWKKRKRNEINFKTLTSKLIRPRTKRIALDYEHINQENPLKEATVEPMESTLVQRFKREWPLHLWRQVSFTDDFIQNINPHWLQFSPPSPSLYYGFGGLYILMALLGCLGNSVVILMYFRLVLQSPQLIIATTFKSEFILE